MEPPWIDLLRWLTGDRETRAIEVTITANDPDYRAIGGGDEEAIWSWHFTIEASAVYWYGGDPDQDDPPSVNEVYVGHGDSLDAAAREVLSVKAELDAHREK